jgi:SAM-dependent methyltransferase
MTSPTLFEPDDNSARSQWDAAADGWNEQAPQIRAWLGDATAAMLDMAGVGPGMKVLDVAAGTGDQSCDIACRVGPDGSVLATDVSPRMLAAAAANLSAAGLGNARTLLTEGETLGLDNANFDAAVCRLGLMFFGNPLAGLQAIRRTFAPEAASARWFSQGRPPIPASASPSRSRSATQGFLPASPIRRARC